VKVNDREAVVKPVTGGVEFSAEVLMVFGKNAIEITATDPSHNTERLIINVMREVTIAKEEAKLPEVKIFKGYQVWLP